MFRVQTCRRCEGQRAMGGDCVQVAPPTWTSRAAGEEKEGGDSRGAWPPLDKCPLARG